MRMHVGQYSMWVSRDICKVLGMMVSFKDERVAEADGMDIWDAYTKDTT